MIDLVGGPFLFDTSAESWFARTTETRAAAWWRAYIERHVVHVSAITVLERIRGYSTLWRGAGEERRPSIEEARLEYVRSPRRVWPLDTAMAALAGEVMALIPEPPTPPKRSHRRAESKSERLARWRFDGMIAATALVTGMTLIHNNPADFEAIRSAIENDPGRFPEVGSLNLVRCGAVAV